MTRLVLAFLAALAPMAARAADPGLPLTLLDGQPPGYIATLSLDQPGQVHGRAPCNRYSGSTTLSQPAFNVEAVMSTKMACKDMAAEQHFFDLLSQMERVDQADGIITLTGNGHEMVFSRQP